MKKYEAIIILDEQKFDDQGESFIKDLRQVIETFGGSAVETTSLGRRQLPKPIRKRATGTFWSAVVMLPEDKVKELREHYRLNTQVLRLELFIYTRPAKVRIERKLKDKAPVEVAPELPA